MARVPLYEGAENQFFYKYLEGLAPLPEDVESIIASCKGNKGEGLEIADRVKVQQRKRLPERTGYYRLQKGGLMIASNISIPDITPEMLIWWSSIYPMDPLLYAIWDPEDHYDAWPDKASVERFLDDSVPEIEKLWGSSHYGTEDMGGGPAPGELHFLNPAEAGFDGSIIGTPECPYLYCANTVFKAGPITIPIFLLETYNYDEEGTPEIRFRAWVGYKKEGEEFKCKIPRFIKVPDAAPLGIIRHNYREFMHLNKALPKLYKEKEAVTEAMKEKWRIKLANGELEAKK